MDWLNGDEELRKTMIGNLIYDKVVEFSSDDKAGKITGMIIGLDDERELLDAVSSQKSLKTRVDEALEIIQD